MVIACLAHGIDVMGFFVLDAKCVVVFARLYPEKDINEANHEENQMCSLEPFGNCCDLLRKLMHYLLGNKTLV